MPPTQLIHSGSLASLDSGCWFLLHPSPFQVGLEPSGPVDYQYHLSSSAASAVYGCFVATKTRQSAINIVVVRVLQMRRCEASFVKNRVVSILHFPLTRNTTEEQNTRNEWNTFKAKKS